jgi:hypothetical protein
MENIGYFCPVLPKLDICRQSGTNTKHEISQFFLIWYSLCSMGGDGKSAMAKLTDTFHSCLVESVRKLRQTAVEYNTMNPTNNLNDKIGF